jgi:uncharacterized protein
MSLEFEWDPRKAHANEITHEVGFEEALTVFGDPLARIFDDEEHSEDESPEIIIGQSTQHRLILVLVCFTVRKTRVRPISARKATPRACRL